MPYAKTCIVCQKRFITKLREQPTCSRPCGNSLRAKVSEEDVRAYFLARILPNLSETECWIWQGAVKRGYGMAYVRRGSIRASRLSYELFVGPIPPGLDILHDPVHCTSPSCVNYHHLRCGTDYDNTQDKYISGTIIQGEDHVLSKLTEDDIREIRRLRQKEKMKYADIATRYGVTFSLIREIVRGNKWHHVDTETYKPPVGDERVKIGDDDIRAIRRLRSESHMKLADIAALYGITHNYVLLICNKKRFAHIDADTYNAPERGGQYKLTEDDVRTIRQLRRDGNSLRSIAEQYGIHVGSVGNLCAVPYRTWKHID